MVSSGNSGVEPLCPSRHRILLRSSNEVHSSYGFVRDARVGNQREQELNSRVVYRSQVLQDRTPTAAESSGPMVGQLMIDSLKEHHATD